MIFMRNKSVKAGNMQNTWTLQTPFVSNTEKLETTWFVLQNIFNYNSYAYKIKTFIKQDRLERIAAKGPKSQDFIEPKVQGI